jgi:hypothetical protein
MQTFIYLQLLCVHFVYVFILLSVHTDVVHSCKKKHMTDLHFDKVSIITRHLKHKFDLHIQAILLKRTRTGHKASESDAKLLLLISNVLSADDSVNNNNIDSSSIASNSSNHKLYWNEALIYTGKLGTPWHAIIHVSSATMYASTGTVYSQEVY